MNQNQDPNPLSNNRVQQANQDPNLLPNNRVQQAKQDPNLLPNNRVQQANQDPNNPYQQDFKIEIEDQLNSLKQSTLNISHLQNTIFRSIFNQLVLLNNKFDTFSDKVNSHLENIQSSIDSLIGFDERLSISLKFISQHLDDFTWTQTVSFFELLLTRINQNNPDHQIPPFSRAEKRKKTLFLNHLDIFWGEIAAILNDPTIQEIRDLVLNPPQPL